MDGRNPCRTTLKPWLKPLLVGVYRGIIIPGLLRWCRIASTVCVWKNAFHTNSLATQPTQQVSSKISKLQKESKSCSCSPLAQWLGKQRTREAFQKSSDSLPLQQRHPSPDKICPPESNPKSTWLWVKTNSSAQNSALKKKNPPRPRPVAGPGILRKTGWKRHKGESRPSSGYTWVRPIVETHPPKWQNKWAPLQMGPRNSEKQMKETHCTWVFSFWFP